MFNLSTWMQTGYWRIERNDLRKAKLLYSCFVLLNLTSVDVF